MRTLNLGKLFVISTLFVFTYAANAKIFEPFTGYVGNIRHLESIGTSYSGTTGKSVVMYGKVGYQGPFDLAVKGVQSIPGHVFLAEFNVSVIASTSDSRPKSYTGKGTLVMSYENGLRCVYPMKLIVWPQYSETYREANPIKVSYFVPKQIFVQISDDEICPEPENYSYSWVNDSSIYYPEN